MDYYGTIGPACAAKEILIEMIQEGMTGLRMNLSHGSLSAHKGWIDEIRSAEEESGRRLKLLIDLQGPELRIGRLSEPAELEEGSEILLGGAHIAIPELICEKAETGMSILLDDGKILLKVLGKTGEGLNCKVERGGVLLSGKSIAMPGSGIYPPTLTGEDYENLAMAGEFGVTGVMLPFVRNVSDLKTLKEALIHAGAPDIQIFAKLENRQGVKALPELLEYADCFVIARGDLGNDMPLWELPAVQKKASEYLRANGRSFMIVTQMLDSMHERAVPTRAEVCDIFNAVLDGADSIMLTGETAAGKYPAEAMKYLVRTGEEALAFKEKCVKI